MAARAALFVVGSRRSEGLGLWLREEGLAWEPHHKTARADLSGNATGNRAMRATKNIQQTLAVELNSHNLSSFGRSLRVGTVGLDGFELQVIAEA